MELVRACALIIAAAAAIGAALSLCGAVSDRLDVFSHFTPFYLAAGVLALILRLADRAATGFITPALAGGAVIACLGLIAPDLLATATRRSASPGPGLKLIQFNVWEHNRDPAGTALWIERQDADVVTLEEVSGAGGKVAQALAATYPHRAAAAQPGRSSTLILSKTPMTASGVFRSSAPGAPACAAWAQFGAGHDAYTVVATHYPWPIPAGPQQAMSRSLAKSLVGFDRASLIVAGDFNSTPWSFSLRAQDARFGLRRLTLALFSWPAAALLRGRLTSPVPFLAIDHVYAGGAWTPVSVRRGPSLGSDHFPVVVVLRRVG